MDQLHREHMYDGPGVPPAGYPPGTGTRQILMVGVGLTTGQPVLSRDRNGVHRVPGQHMVPFYGRQAGMISR